MSISKFFEETLGAKLRNVRQSWGAVDETRRTVFLRLWSDQIERIDTGERVEIGRKQREASSAGYRERMRHIDLLRGGYHGIGVRCVAADPEATPRRIADFDASSLCQLGEVTEDSERVYVRIAGEVAVADLPGVRPAIGQLAKDVAAIATDQTLDATIREMLVNARVGQGEFRAAVLERWGRQCAVTGSKMLEAIRASHIKPWCRSTNSERLDPSNGIPLIAGLDALFDAGLITFDITGQLLVSPWLDAREREILSVNGRRLSRQPSAETAGFLDYHRTTIFRKQRNVCSG